VATRNAAGVLDWQTLFASVSAPASVVPTPPAAVQTATRWKLALREIALAEWTARFTDLGYAAPLTAKVDRFDLSAAVAGEVGATPALMVGPVKASLGRSSCVRATRRWRRWRAPSWTTRASHWPTSASTSTR